MPEKFTTGQVVQLKSGGPKMTVRQYSSNGDNIYCDWFAGNKAESGTFKEEQLQPYVEPKKES